MVLQDTVLYSNRWLKTYGRPGASPEEIQEAVRLACARDIIWGLPEGYKTRVGERGTLFSEGERQRISPPRAFLKDAPILILDEAIRSVDVGTEYAIMEMMNERMKSRTAFMIAHHLSALDRCDTRLEIRNGRLFTAKGAFARA